MNLFFDFQTILINRELTCDATELREYSNPSRSLSNRVESAKQMCYINPKTCNVHVMHLMQIQTTLNFPTFHIYLLQVLNFIGNFSIFSFHHAKLPFQMLRICICKYPRDTLYAT